ncbi:MAG: RNA pyrophosphohydrolase, partial [Boseongicola sp.]|nr:RNA pyrophosphohydrolase [Boseongicola sp.]
MALFNKAGKVLVAERNDRRETAWQLPQGGIDDGETVEQAAFRELAEEIGTSDAEIMAIADETICYDWPSGNSVGRRKKWRGQRITLVALRFLGRDEDIDLNTEHPEFREWRWIALEAIP